MRPVSALFFVTLIALPGCGGSSGGNATGPGAPASIVIYAGDDQAAAKGASLNYPLCTSVLDAAGNRLYGIKVTYTVATGGGQIALPTQPVTDIDGVAISGLWTLGQLAGAQTVTASSPGAGSVTFTAYAN